MNADKKAQQITRTTLEYLQKSRQTHLLPLVVKELQKVVSRNRHDNSAVIHTAHRLDAKDLKSLTDFLTSQTGGKVTVTTRLDPSLLAGFTIRFRDKIFDYSLKNKLDTLQQRITNT